MTGPIITFQHELGWELTVAVVVLSLLVYKEIYRTNKKTASSSNSDCLLPGNLLNLVFP